MKFEDYIKSYSCNFSELSDYADKKGIIESFYEQLKATYKKYFKTFNSLQREKFAVRFYRAKKEMFSSAQMLIEAQTARDAGCIVGYFFLCYYALFHSMQANLFLNPKIDNEKILELAHSNVEKYFRDFYCKGNRSILPSEIADTFCQLKAFREIYSYVMPLNNPNEIFVDTLKVKYYIILCFQLLSLQSFVIEQTAERNRLESLDWIEIEKYFDKCCYKENPITGIKMKDEADVNFFWESRKYNCLGFTPYIIGIEHDFDEYGCYHNDTLENMGFKNCDKVKDDAFKFVYDTIV